MIKTELKIVEKLKRTLKVEVSDDTFLKDKEAVCKDLAKVVKIPGFRVGTVPWELIEKKHKDLMVERFINDHLSNYYLKAIEEHSLNPVGEPRIYDVNMSEEKFSFSVDIEVKPDIEIKEEDYKNIKIKTKPVSVTELEIEKFITQLKEDIKNMIGKDYPDESIAKWFGFINFEELREFVRARIFLDKISQREGEIRSLVMDEITRRVKFNIPPLYLKRVQDSYFNRYISDLKKQGAKEEEIKKYEDNIREKIKPIAEKDVKFTFIVEAIAKKENLEVKKDYFIEAMFGYICSCAEYTT
ncbi:MAG: hypothetical protein NC817_00450 [Candidatus Omnitrophica bacterium]|nr:hypothetical protein [Candidatus Omnitrophota bacterium]MCM8823912.1 hypothetical protein [Candidatus Omnitrophota bacterium]MCM8826081.1 hypothetical protein [Candidatus Omnitrophota bacterium]